MANGRMRSVSASRFAMVPRNDIPRSAFDVSHIHKTTFRAGFLVPIYVDEVLPGDSLRLNMTAFARLATPIVPVMDNLTLESFFFFVPNRLVWSNWERFMGEQLNPTDTTIFLTPYVTYDKANLLPGTLPDYFGITLNAAGTVNVSALPFRAYNLIYNDWFRDQDLITPAVVDLDDGPDSEFDYFLRSRSKQHDYFTSARPWPLKPLNIEQFPGTLDGTNQINKAFFQRGAKIGAPVSGIGKFAGSTSIAGPLDFTEAGARVESFPNYYRTDTANRLAMRAISVDGPLDVKVMVNDMRIAIMVQGLFETNARGGTRYTELVRSHFGVMSPDARFQRPELLGGGRSMINIQAVQQASATGLAGGTTVQGNLAGMGTMVATRHGFSSTFTEHGHIIGLLNVKPDLNYQQGINRMWFRRTQYDFYWPGLAHLGEQLILNREIYAQATAADTAGFGYQERWSEYKYKPSRTSGYFRSTSATPLDMWHFGEKFTAPPALNTSFVIMNGDPIDRSLTVPGYSAQQILIDALFDARWVRAMPMYSIPGIGKNL